MISKFYKIRNIGSFQHFDWDAINPSGDNIFKKFNILYGENSTGKTTIVKILKSINAGTDLLLKKNWNRQNEDRSVEIKLMDSDISFLESSGWANNSLANYFVFFDKNFIEDHVHSSTGRTVNHDKNTGKLILYLGDFHSYKNQLDNLDQLRRNLEEKNKEFKKAYSDDLQAIISGKSFVEADLESAVHGLNSLTSNEKDAGKNQISNEIDQVNKEYARLSKIISQSESVANLEKLVEIEAIADFDVNKIQDALSFTVSSGTVDVLNKIKGKEDFIHEGMNLVKKNNLQNCPFCEQSIAHGNSYSHIVNEYKKIFDEEFSKIQEEKLSVLKGYRDVLRIFVQFRVPVDNDVRLKKIVDLELIDPKEQLLFSQLPDKTKADLIEELSAVDNKISNLLTPGNSGRVVEIKDLIATLNQEIQKYNTQIARINDLIRQQQEALSKGELSKQTQSLLQKRNDLEKDQFILMKHSQLVDVFSRKTVSEGNQNTILKLNELLDSYRVKVKGKFDDFVALYFSDIEKYLLKLCPRAELKIVASRSTYDLRAGEVLCGLELRYKDKDRLEDLSEGEKQSIALAFFLAFLNKLNNKGDKILVFDDPITSFDAGKRKIAAELIYEKGACFKQLFVFTCDPLFRYYCIKNFDNRRFFYVLKSASSGIHYIPNNRTTIYSSFKTDFRSIDQVNGTDDNIIVYGQKLRFCLEEVKDVYLGYGEDSFDQILIKVRNGDLEKLKKSIDGIVEIYKYCNTGGLAHYPRDGQTSWEELKFKIKKYLRLGI